MKKLTGKKAEELVDKLEAGWWSKSPHLWEEWLAECAVDITHGRQWMEINYPFGTERKKRAEMPYAVPTHLFMQRLAQALRNLEEQQ